MLWGGAAAVPFMGPGGWMLLGTLLGGIGWWLLPRGRRGPRAAAARAVEGDTRRPGRDVADARVDRLTQRLARLERREAQRRWGRRALLAAIFVPFAAWAAQVTMPHVFVNGTPADATEVNANFDTLVAESNDQDLRLQSIEGTTSTSLSGCVWTGYVNNYNATFTYTCPANAVLAGVGSIHDNGNEDRRFRFLCCNIVQD